MDRCDIETVPKLVSILNMTPNIPLRIIGMKVSAKPYGQH